MTLVSNVYLTHGLMLLCAFAAAYNACPKARAASFPNGGPR